MSDTAILRADGGADIGMGHLMRCIGFAEGCLQQQIQPVLVTSSTSALENVQHPDALELVSLPDVTTDREDAAFTLDAYEQWGAGPLVTDLCHAEYQQDPDRYRDYLKQLNEHVSPLVVIDDLFSFAFPADVMVNPGYGAADRDYPADEDVSNLLGPEYFIFRSEFIQQRQEMDPYAPREVEHIVVTLGGSDLNNVLETVCHAIERLDAPRHVHAITGVEDPDGWMTRLQRESDRKWTFTRMCNRMAEVLAEADLAVTGGGLTKYETALLGVPSVVLSQVEHQHTLMTDFQEAETCLYTGRAGSIDEEELADTLQSLSSSPDRLAEMSRNGQKLVDGNGRKRIIDYLTS